MTLDYLWREGGPVKAANLLTLTRGVLILPIVATLMGGRILLPLIVYGAAVLTDGLDGWLARRSGRTSDFGATLDAVVDNLLSVAIALFMWLSVPEVFTLWPLSMTLLFLVPLLYLPLSWAMTGKVLMFHFTSARIGAFLLFALWPLVALTGITALVPLTALVVVASRTEQVVFILRGGRDQDARHGACPIPSIPVDERPRP